MKIRRQLITLILAIAASYIFAAEPIVVTYNKTNKFKAKDFSKVFLTREGFDEDPHSFANYQPLGVVGAEYERIRIHYTSVNKDSVNPLIYEIIGKTMVKRNICEIYGNLTIDSIVEYAESDEIGTKQGYTIGKYRFEELNCKYAGIFEGKFKSYYVIRKNAEPMYDDINFASDGFENNLYEGTWISKETGKHKICNWGDSRIPGIRGLDDGTGLFLPSEEFNDWKSYRLAVQHDSITKEINSAIEFEKWKWWK